ncbi:MAG: HAD-IC family P-type ATPase, partial [Spirochaetaceae bacterium]|nr:HAD-IC family P-type ATPase [Spirochaetaceae bacterium]
MTNKKQYHTLTVEETVKSLETDPKSGLSSSEAGVRLNKYGRNKLKAKSGISPWKILADQFKDIIIVLLVIAAAVSFSIGDYIEGAAVLVVILITAFFGFITEYRAERSVEELQKMITPIAKVMRDGEIDEIDASELVPGDIIIIEEGDRINADGRILEADDLLIDESLLTGESEPVVKHTEHIASSGKVAVADRKNMVYMGTMAAGGNGVAIVTNTGLGTQMGQISTMLSETEEESTPIEKQLAKTGRFLIIITFVITAVVAVVGVILGEPLVEMLKTSIALAVAAVPEGLPAVATITLAVGMSKMAKKNALMKNLPAVETLGSTTVICTDKTGTLTENQMTVQEIYLPGRNINVTGTGYEPSGKFLEDEKETEPLKDPVLSLFLKAGLLSSNAVLSDDEGWTVIGDPTEGALITAAGKAGVDDTGYERLDELPFDSDRKYMADKVKDESGNSEIFLKGAPGVVMELCGFIMEGDSVHILDAKKKEELLKINSEMAGRALRILALSYKKDFDADNIVDDEVTKGMVFLGFAGILDPPRPDIYDSIEQARSAGIRVVMITGDQKDTALAIANKVGIETGDGTVVSGFELDGLSIEELSEVLE